MSGAHRDTVIVISSVTNKEILIKQSKGAFELFVGYALHESGHTNMAVPYYSSPICQALHSPVHFLIIFTMVTLSTLFHKVITLVKLQGKYMQLKLQKQFRFLSYKKNEIAISALA